MAVAISALDFPRSTSLVFIRKMGMKVFAAGELKQCGARTLGFQNCGSSVVFVHERSTIQTKPFDPERGQASCRLHTHPDYSTETFVTDGIRARHIDYRSLNLDEPQGLDRFSGLAGRRIRDQQETKNSGLKKPIPEPVFRNF